MPREVNPCGKTVKRENAYEVWQAAHDWTWYVLKKWRHPRFDDEPYSRWYCNVVSPFTSERGDTGDVYVAEIKAVARKLERNPLAKDDTAENTHHE